MSSKFRGNTSSMRAFAKKLRTVSRVAAVQIAKKAAPEVTGELTGDFDAGQTAYGTPRPLGVNGNPLSLVASGATRGDLGFKSDGGTKLRAVLPTKYAKYLIGKYGILPVGGLPTAWSKLLAKTANSVIDKHMEAG